MTSAELPHSEEARLPKYLTATEAAEVLRMTPYEVARLCREGSIRASRPGRAWLIRPDAIRAYVEGEVA